MPTPVSFLFVCLVAVRLDAAAAAAVALASARTAVVVVGGMAADCHPVQSTDHRHRHCYCYFGKQVYSGRPTATKPRKDATLCAGSSNAFGEHKVENKRLCP